MPNIKSAFKRMAQNASRRAVNRATKSAVATARADLLAAIKAGDKSKADELYRKFCSVLDKAAKRGIIARNNVSRGKSRLGAHIAAMAKSA